MEGRVYNFSAGPAVLPEEVLREAADEMLNYKGSEYVVNGGEIGPMAQKLYDELTGIQWGRNADPFGWTCKLPKE